MVVLAPEVVDVGRADQAPAHLARDLDDPLVGLVLLGQAVLLDLEVDVVRAVDLDEVVGVLAGLGRVVGDQPLAEARLEAAGERDDALGVALEQLEVDVGLAAPVALEEAVARQLDEVAKPGIVLGEQREVVALVPDRLGLPVLDQVGLEAENRLDSVLLAGLVELDRAIHDPVIGQPEGRLAELRGPLRQGVDLARAIEQRVLAVDVQMCAGGRAHRKVQLRFRTRRNRAVAGRPVRYLEGRMFWLWQNTLRGSQRSLTATRRS